MVDKLQQIDWQKILLQPQQGWYSKACPVVEVTLLDESGEVMEKRLARVSPVHENLNIVTGNPGLEVGSEIVSLDYEKGEDNVSSSTSGVEVEVLKAGGWKDEWAKQTHVIEFRGFTTDEDKKDKKWSNTFI